MDPREPQTIDMIQLENSVGQTMLYNVYTDAQIGVPQGQLFENNLIESVRTHHLYNFL